MSESTAAFPSTLAERLNGVRAGVEDAAAQSGRAATDLTLVVVTKFHPASLVRDLVELGVRDFGENRHQDAAPKARELASLPLVWHFIGQLQSNKVRAVTEYASVLHSLDRASLVEALDAVGQPLDVFIQVNLTENSARGGVALGAIEPLAERILGSSALYLRGLMAVAPLRAEPRSAFATVRSASERLRVLAPEATDLSMGMSGDYREAILEGATHLRIGTAITGNRLPAG